jgi:hypothetical protein
VLRRHVCVNLTPDLPLDAIVVRKEFNCLLWLPPNEQGAGDIVMTDSTHFVSKAV